MRASLAAAAAFLLPLGSIGLVGVGVAGLFLIVSISRGFRGRPLIIVAVPAAVMAILSTVLAPSPSQGVVLSAIGMATLYTAGLAAMLAMRDLMKAERLAAAFVLGSTVLALSVILDATVHWHRIPAGLFNNADLHNWAAALLILAWPLSAHLFLAERRRWAAVPMALLPTAVVVALSWSGTLGLIVAALVYLAHPKAPLGAWFRVLAAAIIIAVPAGSFLALQPRLGLMGEVASSRARIATEGLQLAKLRPLRGWGFSVDRLGPAFSREPLGTYYVDDEALAHFHDLFVQQLFENGIVGLTALALLISTLLVLQRGPIAPATVASAAGFLVAQSFDYSWHVSSILLSFFLVASLGLPRAREPAR